MFILFKFSHCNHKNSDFLKFFGWEQQIDSLNTLIKSKKSHKNLII